MSILFNIHACPVRKPKPVCLYIHFYILVSHLDSVKFKNDISTIIFDVKCSPGSWLCTTSACANICFPFHVFHWPLNGREYQSSPPSMSRSRANQSCCQSKCSLLLASMFCCWGFTNYRCFPPKNEWHACPAKRSCFSTSFWRKSQWFEPVLTLPVLSLYTVCAYFKVLAQKVNTPGEIRWDMEGNVEWEKWKNIVGMKDWKVWIVEESE